MTTQKLINKASALIEAARAAGADAADAVVVRSRSTSVSVRLGQVEATQAAESDDFSLRVFVEGRVATISANIGSEATPLAERAVAMAKVAPLNPYEGLADGGLLVKSPRDLDLFDETHLTVEQMREEALAMEAAALEVKGVTNSGGAGVSVGSAGLVLVTSHGFCGHYNVSHFSRSCSALAGEGVQMERDYDYTTAVYLADLDEAVAIGQNAGLRAVRRLNAKKMKTGRVDVVFEPRMARSIASHLASCVNGAAVARKTSLLRNKMGEKIMRPGLNVIDDPLRKRSLASHPFDGEGVEGQKLAIIKDGILQDWLLSCAPAKELGLVTNGRGARSGNSVSPSSSNFSIEAGTSTPEELIANVKNGIYVTELVGHGVDFVTGQYSRGASGFRIENGALTQPVSEVTLGSDLLHMFAHLIPANDLDRRFATASPTLLIEGMALAGE